ncbi:barstar family protein [Streptomyces bobili]|uniref:Barstar family protein n=1 Tax=Streptomyces bobili TaxID=67280 RepID=A0ABZ1QPZ6_9ACTN|nr:barstar family protein [Streptomyces bobili]
MRQQRRRGHLPPLGRRGSPPQVLTIARFHCAPGEAVNGPGGYFGWNLAAVDDCLGEGFAAAPPFTLEWQHSASARARLVSDLGGNGAFFEVLPEIFMDRGIDVLLR